MGKYVPNPFFTPPTGPRVSPTPPVVPATSSKPSTLDRALSILNTPAGAALVNAAGTGIASYGANKSANANAAADRELNAQQFAARSAQDQLNADRQHQLSQSTAAVNASPLGEAQMFAQRNAMLLPLLTGARNVSVHPGDPAVAAAMGGGVQGGFRLPEGGLNPAMLQRLYGEDATLESIKNRQLQVGRLDPRAAGMNLGAMFGDKGVTASGEVADANALELQRQLDEEAKQRQLIQRAIDEDIRGTQQQQQQQLVQQKKKKGGNIFGKALKAISTGVSFIPGLGQTLAPVLAGAGGLINGDGLKASLLDAGLAAVPAGLGKVAKAGKGAGAAARVARVASKVPSDVYQMGINSAIRGGR